MVDRNGKELKCPFCEIHFLPDTCTENNVMYTFCTACNKVISSFLVHPIESAALLRKLDQKLGLSPD